MRGVVTLAICLLCATAQADDWGARRNPFDPVVVARYKSILARDPHDVALKRLVALYQRYQTIAKLETEYRAQPEAWPSLVVLARLPRTDRGATIALWNRALQMNPKDGRGWLALGDATMEPKAARTAFQRAVDHAGTPRDKRAALVKLIGAARSAGDPKTVDAGYAELIALSPKDGQLWLDRGSAQLAANQPTPAIESFAKAESLLAGDPERRLVAMMNRGLALERLGLVEEAIKQWETTLDRSPRGSYLRRDIVPRIVDAERKRSRLGAAIAFLEKRWPKATRQYYEWDYLADLYAEVHDDEPALAAYRRAVAKAPTEVETQRKLIRMLDKLRPSEALKQHEAAAKIAPGDANLQIELAKRYRDTEHDTEKAFATLDRMTKRLAKNVGARLALVELYVQWEELGRELVEREAVANLEPMEPDHAIALGDAYWRADHRPKAIAAWQRLAKIKTAATQLRLAELLALHNVWAEAAVAFTSSLDLDGKNAEAWRGRARANSELGKNAAAVADARRAVALIGPAPDTDGSRVRFELVRALGRLGTGRDEELPARAIVTGRLRTRAGDEKISVELGRWRFAFDRGDLAAGYLLVAHHARIQSHQHHDTLLELYRRVPTDDALGVALVRSHSKRKEFARARAEIAVLAKRSPKRAEYFANLIDQVDADEKRVAEEVFREEEGNKPALKDIVGRRRRGGIRFGVGADVQGTSSALLDIGLVRWWGVAKGTAFGLRMDWTQRDDNGDQVNAFGAGGGITKRVLSTRRFEVALGIGPRIEFRYGNNAMTSAWRRSNISGDLSLDVLPRALPGTLGLRLQQALTDHVRGTAVLVELGFEVR